MNIFDMEVHPAAEIFPMLDDEELDELAADIKANGLVHPIVVKDGLLVDGRNRREGCKRAGVEPRTEELNGMDPVAYILSSNIARRHMTKGQRAMAVAKLYPEAAKLRRKGSSSSEIEGLAAGYVSMARTVLRILPTVADEVLGGITHLDAAYKRAKVEEDAALVWATRYA